MTKVYSKFERDRQLEIERAKALKELKEQAYLEEKATVDPSIETFNSLAKEVFRNNTKFARASNIVEQTQKLTNEAAVDLLTESFFNSLDFIDDFILNLEEDSIKSTAKTFINGLLEEDGINGLFESCNSNTVEELLLIVESIASMQAQDASDGDVGGNEPIDPNQDINDADNEPSKTVAKIAAKNSIVKSSLNSISKKVSSKVKTTLKNEKEIADANKEQEDSLIQEGVSVHKRNYDMSLFRSIHQNVMAGSLNESASDPKIAITEALIQYSLLEFANTIGLLKLTNEDVKQLAGTYRKI